jgi:adenylate cyclase
MVNYQNKIFPAISLETLSQHEEGFDPVPVKAEDGTLVGMSVGPRFIPTNNQGEMIINYRGNEEQFKIFSATDILQNKIDLRNLAGKTILVGATAVGIYDLRVTPVSPVLPGVFVQANLVDNLYQGDFLRESSWTRFGALIVMLVISLILAWSLPRLKIVLGLLLIGSVMTLYLFFVQWAFGKGLLFPLVTPTFQWLFVSLAITIQRGVHEERQKRSIRRIFRSYLHPDIVEELIHDPEKLKLGGQRVDCTIFFSDVRNFTDASEKMAPETVVQLMNEYFDPVSKEIIRYGGYIDKFLGDGIMAIFGAPKKTDDHPFLACQASLEVLKKVRELEPLFQEKFGLPNFRIGIGLHTGPVILGNIGTAERLNYTVMGDSVNLAARLQGANKELGTTILVSQKTYDRVADKVSARYIDTIRVKGKEEAIPVYEILELKK